MKNKSIRVQINEGELKALEKIGDRYGCIYRGKLSLSRFLSKVASGELNIAHQELIKPEAPSKPLIELSFKTISDLNGTIAAIAQKIADFQGNIFGILAKDYDDVIKISLSLPEKCEIYSLFDSLMQITIQDIESYNSIDKKEHLMGVIKPEVKAYYDKLRNINPEHRKNVMNEFLKDNKNVSILSHVSCAIGFKIKIKNTPGRLAELTKKFAKHHISIVFIEQDLDIRDPNFNSANIFLGFTPKQEIEYFKEIRNIENFTNSLKRLNYVKTIKRISIDYLRKY